MNAGSPSRKSLSRREADQLCQTFKTWSTVKAPRRRPDALDVMMFNVSVTFQSDYCSKCTHEDVVNLFRRRGLIG